jgi:hypothetical protein
LNMKQVEAIKNQESGCIDRIGNCL